MFRAADQELLHQYAWDYTVADALPNRIFEALKDVPYQDIPNKDERYWVQQILWIWYHHAVSCALWRYGDVSAARTYSKKALEVQPTPHPNNITKLLYYLIHDDLIGAERWAKGITTEPEHSTAQDTITLYKSGDFFKAQV